VTLKSIAFLCYQEWVCGLCLRKVDQGVLELLIGNVLAHFTLTLDPVTPRSIRFICYPGWMYGPGMRKVGQGVLQLLVGNGFGTFDHGDIDL